MRKASSLFAGAAALAAGVLVAAPASATPAPATVPGSGAVYLLGNQTSGNAVLAFPRQAGGTLGAPRSFPTGGRGTGAGLGSQGAVALDSDGQYLYAVDAGSNTITSFRVQGLGLVRVGQVSSAGITPISVTIRGDRLYVLNAGGAGNIAGFSVAAGVLEPLAGTSRPLSSDASGPAQVAFSPDGSLLLVTEKTTNTIDVFRLNGRGLPVGVSAVASSGTTPFGFAFTPNGRAIVSEAGASTTSSYRVAGGSLKAATVSVPNTQAAACWVAVTADGRHAYTGNGGGSNSVSEYAVDTQGRLGLLDGHAAGTTGGTSDIALSRGSTQFLYARLSDGNLAQFALRTDGSLVPIGSVAGVPSGSAGLVAR